MTGLTIKPATTEGMDWVARQMSATSPWTTLGISLDQCRKTCQDPEYKLFIANIQDNPCGGILVDPRGVAGSPYIKSIVVSENYRSKGIGSQLIAFVEKMYHTESRHLFLCVSSFNVKAMKLYEQQGFKRIGELEDYIVDGESEILMHKRIH